MILDFGNGLFLRRATEADHPALAMVCLKTGDAGEDATDHEDDPELMGMIYAVPYQVLEPELAFVVDGPVGVCGSLLGAADTLAFNARLAAEWYPALQRRVSDPGGDPARWTGSDWVRRMVHQPDLAIPDALSAYPSHGHIDLLPPARGRGIGSRAVAFLAEQFAERGSTGFFMPVNPRNLRALRFYERIGLQTLPPEGLPTYSVFVARRLRK
jgi:ribosomal protein S18 acetylase RimI-like enzyme